MEYLILFNFRQEFHEASYVICEKEHPNFIYVSLKQPLASLFGEEVVISCNGNELLENNIHTDAHRELYLAILNAIIQSGTELKFHTTDQRTFFKTKL